MQSTGYSLRYTSTRNLFVPRPSSNFMKITLHYSCAILWNALPSNLKTVTNVDIFKKKYCEYLSLQQDHY